MSRPYFWPSGESEKYPGISRHQEVALDWILDFALRHGRMPTAIEIKKGSHSKPWHVYNLIEAGYLVSRDTNHFPLAIGPRIRDVAVTVLFGKVRVAPFPEGGLFPEEAEDLAERIAQAAREAETIRANRLKLIGEIPPVALSADTTSEEQAREE